eukprot:TRINITY_DN1878_c0_g1_i16.p3 TRINITY_DN1878_c0_g1~~TRINITY_DN1878_c0_g1_i16.p3  ORF type:complete len:141 (-),score=9.18 TRINITY_DN1878_c0_g1_i16:1180-1602(-)
MKNTSRTRISTKWKLNNSSAKSLLPSIKITSKSTLSGKSRVSTRPLTLRKAPSKRAALLVLKTPTPLSSLKSPQEASLRPFHVPTKSLLDAKRAEQSPKNKTQLSNSFELLTSQNSIWLLQQIHSLQENLSTASRGGLKI